MNAVIEMPPKKHRIPPYNRFDLKDNVSVIRQLKSVRGRVIANVGDIGTVLACGVTPLTGQQWVEIRIHRNDRIACMPLEDVKKIG